MTDIQKHILDNLETYKDLFDNAHDLIHLVEPGGTVIYVNNSWKRVLGYSLNEIQGQSVYSIVDDSDRDRFINYRKQVLNGTYDNDGIVIAFRAKTGSIVYLEGKVSPKIVNGRPLYTRGIFRDVSDHIKIESELRALNDELTERETNLKKLLFYAPDAVIVVDNMGRVTYWNPKAAEIFGWSAEEVTGRRLTELIIPSQYQRAHEEGMRRYLTTGEIHVLNKTIEITAVNKERREFYVSLTISSTYQQGEVAFIAFLRDIDQQKRNAIELEQKKLQLEESNKQLERFAHTASHDIKEPIRKIQLFIDRIKLDIGNSLSTDSQTYLTKVESAALRLTHMVEGILTYSTLSAEQSPFETVDLNMIMRDVKNDLELIIENKQAKLNYQSLPVIEGIPFLLHQLFYNLVHNSLKFSRPNVAPLIDVTCQTHSAEEGKVTSIEIIVKDNGIGFSQAYAEDIFNTFYRLHNKDKFEGTGLGLSLCKNIVEKHKGTITAYSAINEGASFIIVLPHKQSSRPGSA